MAEHDTNTAPDLTHCEFYSYVDCRSLCSSFIRLNRWLKELKTGCLVY